ncbi:tropinone reductase homolog At1g07440-like [Amborella trichopoda]|uniref:tropinone reductase homolog At1g07440-like n=1 Tax=Amborella trichopoda TaxID=13333 RepID=UPI0009BDFF25|nr:tropinone reductase homolog At1g07440-like [Amborella trichopoda]|eukprot:XP_020524127.1 tropinone reductase homolog At1g07440-like [Amborella trichopoda]
MEGVVSKEREERWSLRHTTALVTGGTKGIGRAIVEEKAGSGASVYTCNLDEGELNQCLHEWKAMGSAIHGLVCDISLRPNWEKLVETVSAHFKGKLNFLLTTNDKSQWLHKLLSGG